MEPTSSPSVHLSLSALVLRLVVAVGCLAPQVTRAEDSIASGMLVPYFPPGDASPPAAGANALATAPTTPSVALPAVTSGDYPLAPPGTTNASGVPGVFSSVPLPPQTPSRTAIHTHDGRFIVGGMSSAENLHLAEEIERWTTAIEKRLGRTTPWLGQGQVIGIAVPPTNSTAQGYRRMQGWEGGRFYQRIATPPPAVLDSEDLQVALAATLLTRCAAALIPRARRTGMGPRPPDWLSAGIAQSLLPSVAARNREWVAMELSSPGRSPMTFADVLKLQRLPPGRWREKAYAQAAVDFLCPQEQAPGDAFAPLLDAIVRGITPDIAFVTTTFSARFRNRPPEDEWQTFLASWCQPDAGDERSANAPMRTGGRDYAMEQNLLRTLVVHPAEWVENLPPDAPSELAAADLVAFRNTTWAAPLATALRSFLIASRTEASPVLQNVCSAYEAYFEYFRHPPEALPERRLFRRTPKRADPSAPLSDDAWDLTLTQLWHRAQSLHQAYLARQHDRTAWLDAVESTYLARHPLSPSPATPAPRSSPPRTPTHLYLDSFVNSSSSAPAANGQRPGGR